MKKIKIIRFSLFLLLQVPYFISDPVPQTDIGKRLYFFLKEKNHSIFKVDRHIFRGRDGTGRAHVWMNKKNKKKHNNNGNRKYEKLCTRRVSDTSTKTKQKNTTRVLGTHLIINLGPKELHCNNSPIQRNWPGI